MKNDQEFLNGMWQKASILEREELEKARVKALNRGFTIKAIYISALSMLIFIALIWFSKFIYEAIYPITISILFSAFVYEALSNKIWEDKTYANYNIKFK
jgi:phosphoglycerol transferase MdoB-like AlkP superfamily enzyme